MKHDLEQLTKLLVAFRDERDWKQFHNPKDLSLALSVEAAELLECFLWKSPEEANPQKLREELADVFAYALLLAHELDMDVAEIVRDKIELNRRKYPVDKSIGSARKYDEL